MTLSISQRDVYTAVKTTLEEIPGIGENVYWQKASGGLPEDQWGRILPGVIIDTRFPSPLSDLPVNDQQLLDARVFRIQTRCFAETPEVLMDMCDAVAEELTGLQIGRGSLRHTTEDEPTQPYFLDPDLDRPYTALYWRIATQ